MIKRIYRPTSDLDKRLLASIPQKILSWATLIDPEAVTPGVEGGFNNLLHWYFDEDISYVGIDRHTSVKVRIVGPLDKPTDVYGFEPWMEDITNNLEHFTAFEKSFYDMMEQFAKEKQENLMNDFVETTTRLVNERNV